MLILAIETSCDDTAASIIKTSDSKLNVLSNIVSSQVKIHAKWGGVVPNLAAREHLKNIIPVLEMTLKKSGVKPVNIDLIAVTQGPGLIPALLIGTNVARTLSYVWKKPLIGIHHIEGHIYANFIGESQMSKVKGQRSDKKFPILCLVVSGGHTQLILMKKHLDYKIVGETLDDAAGEAFDKVARILNLGYPGGPIISAMAEMRATRNMQQVTKKNKNLSHVAYNMSQIKLPRPMINSNNLNFSFSGLKTAVLYETKNHPKIFKNLRMKSALCAEFQQAVIDVLIAKTAKAAKIYNPKTIMLAGGVAANKELRKQLGNKIKKELKNTLYIIPDTLYSVDNATMITAAGAFRWQFMTTTQRKKYFNNWKTLQPDANLKLK